MITNKFGEDVLTVSEVIDILKHMPQDLPVWHEGCGISQETTNAKAGNT